MQAFSLSGDATPLYQRGGIDVIPLSEALGAELIGVDLSQDFGGATFAAIHRAWLEYGVILIRDQQLTDADLVRISRRFGELDMGPRMAWQTRSEHERFPEIYVVSNVVENGHPIGYLGNQELDWHTDMSHTEIPPKASTLYALEIPADGSGRTGFMNLYRVLDALPSALRRQIEALWMKHDPAHTIQGELRVGYRAAEFEDVAQASGPIHPMVRTHAETGRRALYLGRQWNGSWRSGYILGLSRAESDALQDTLWNIVREEQFVWYHDWRVGDFLMWDNRCVMHRREPFTADMRRVMHRTQIRDSQRPS